MNRLRTALPSVASDLGARGGLDVDWVVTGFLIGVVMIQPASAWRADRWGWTAAYLTDPGPPSGWGRPSHPARDRPVRWVPQDSVT